MTFEQDMLYFEKQAMEIQNLSQLQPEIIAEGPRQENVQQNQLRRRARTPRARRARNNNIMQNVVGQKVPSQTYFFTFFKIKRNRQQGDRR